MAKRNIKLKDYKTGFSNFQKKNGINFWRFFFPGINEENKEECFFCLEFESLNSSISDKNVLFSLTQKKISSEDIQSAILGNISTLTEQNNSKSSYCSVRLLKLGKKSKQLCQFISIKEVDFDLKNMELKIGNKLFTEKFLSGFLSITNEDDLKNKEIQYQQGYSTWNLEYKIKESELKGYHNDSFRWFPLGIKTDFVGRVNFDGEDYIVDTRIALGHIDRFFGNSYPNELIHIYCSNLVSMISGRKLENSAFCIQGVFENRVTLIGNLEDIDISIFANKSKRTYNCVYDCMEVPGIENHSEKMLHWSFSLNYKQNIVDIDIFCKLSELYNRIIEKPEGNRNVLNLLEGGTGFGEIKLYRKNKKAIEQIEHAKLTKVICEFGMSDKYN